MRGRRTVVGLVLLAVGIVLVIWITAGETIVERWLVSRLDSSDAQVRLDAARRLAEMESTWAVERLLESFRVEGSGDVHAEVECLVEMGEFAVEALKRTYEQAGVFVRLRVLGVFRRMGENAKSATPLILGVDHEYLFGEATQALAAMGSKGERGLLELLRHERHQLRLQAADALAELHPRLRTDIESFARDLDRLDSEVRRSRYGEIRRSILVSSGLLRRARDHGGERLRASSEAVSGGPAGGAERGAEQGPQ